MALPGFPTVCRRVGCVPPIECRTAARLADANNFSTSAKIAMAARIPEAEAEKASDAIMLFLLEAVSHQSESHD